MLSEETELQILVVAAVAAQAVIIVATTYQELAAMVALALSSSASRFTLGWMEWPVLLLPAMVTVAAVAALPISAAMAQQNPLVRAAAAEPALW